MLRTALLVMVVTALSPTIAMAGSEGPWAEIRVGGVAERERNEHEVMLVAINGSMDFPDQSTYRLPPGPHGLRLASRLRSGRGVLTATTLSLELEPCMRYVLVADHANPDAARAWRPKLLEAQIIESCAKKFAASVRDPAMATRGD
ncbi:MAG: hypothetical protein KF800_06730 [Lysobacter sp.]|nr:hypothetical protein [Lysobacter sp.]